MAVHFSAHLVLWPLAVLACLTVVLYNPIFSAWPMLTGDATYRSGRLPCYAWWYTIGCISPCHTQYSRKYNHHSCITQVHKELHEK